MSMVSQSEPCASPEGARVFSIVGPSGRFIIPCEPHAMRSFLSAARALGSEPSEILLAAVQEAMEATVALAAATGGSAQ